MGKVGARKRFEYAKSFTLDEFILLRNYCRKIGISDKVSLEDAYSQLYAHHTLYNAYLGKIGTHWRGTQREMYANLVEQARCALDTVTNRMLRKKKEHKYRAAQKIVRKALSRPRTRS